MLHLTMIWEQAKKEDVDFLTDLKTAETFSVVLSNRYQVLQELHDDDEGADINSQWKDIKEAVNYACEEVVGRRKPHQKEWLLVETRHEQHSTC